MYRIHSKNIFYILKTSMILVIWTNYYLQINSIYFKNFCFLNIWCIHIINGLEGVGYFTPSGYFITYNLIYNLSIFFYKKDRNIFGMIFNMCALNDLDSNFRCEEIQMFFSLLKLLTLWKVKDTILLFITIPGISWKQFPQLPVHSWMDR